MKDDLARRLKVRALGWAAGLGCAGLGSAAVPTAAGLGLCCADGCWAGLGCCADGCVGGSQVLKNWRATWPFGGSQKWDRPVAPNNRQFFEWRNVLSLVLFARFWYRLVAPVLGPRF